MLVVNGAKACEVSFFFCALSRGQYNTGTINDGGEREGVDFQSEVFFSEFFRS